MVEKNDKFDIFTKFDDYKKKNVGAISTKYELQIKNIMFNIVNY